MQFTLIFICFIASTIGTICGIGGGVIIKPVLDSMGVMGVAEISFLSGCTVLAMSIYNVARNAISKESGYSLKTELLLSIGAVIGGIAGKNIFEYLSGVFGHSNRVGSVQSVCLFVLTFGTLIYSLNKSKIRSRHTDSILLCIIIGLFLGMASSFLGIGGGPFNLVILYFFFSMESKKAARTSLFIIMFSQLASLMNTVVTGTVPDFNPWVLISMALAGIGGGYIGTRINKKISNQIVDKLFILLIIVILMITAYNFYQYTYLIY